MRILSRKVLGWIIAIRTGGKETLPTITSASSTLTQTSFAPAELAKNLFILFTTGVLNGAAQNLPWPSSLSSTSIQAACRPSSSGHQLQKPLAIVDLTYLKLYQMYH